jgi:NhaA family Na+:H+ antiporter
LAHDSNHDPTLPSEPIDRVVGPLARFLHVEAASGIVLLACTVVALILANSQLSDRFLGFWQTRVGVVVGSFEMVHSLKHWINDGLMAIFFFVIGLEVKRELVLGELRDMRQAVLPVAAALGGMIVPAGLYLALQAGEAGARGWGIPMATDIAFVVGCMAVLGPRVPHMLRITLLSLAIVDDIGAILVIAIGYTDEINLTALVLGFVGVAAVAGLARAGLRSVPVYTVIGVLVWLAFHESGVHATIAGVILGLMTPARSYIGRTAFAPFLERASEILQGGEWKSEPHRAQRVLQFKRAARETVSPLEILEHQLHPWVGFAIMPVFALANAGVVFHASDLVDPVATAVMAGLVVGKPLGIVLFSWLAVRLVLKRLPEGVGWGALAGGGCLAGIGFTMALFIAGLALDESTLDAAKVGVLAASAISAALGMTLLLLFLPGSAAADD